MKKLTITEVKCAAFVFLRLAPNNNMEERAHEAKLCVEFSVSGMRVMESK